MRAGRYIGQILVDGGFLSRRELELALEEQRHTKELLGELLIRMGLLDPADLKAALSVQGHLSRLEDAVRVAAGGREILGTLLLRAGRISESQLEQAVAEQEKCGQRLGEVLVRLGYVTERQLEALLDFQRGQATAGPSAGPLRLGDILVSAGHISRAQLDRALRKQVLSRKMLGDVLVEEGYAKPQQVRHGIGLQKKLMASVLAAILSLASLPDADAAPSGTASAELRVSATVLPFTALKVLNQSPTVTITAGDIARGYVDMPAGTSIEVRSNSREGYYLSFDCFDTTFKEVRIDGLGKSAMLEYGIGMIPMAMSGRASRLELSFRFVLSENAQPGAYPWPLTVSVIPM